MKRQSAIKVSRQDDWMEFCAPGVVCKPSMVSLSTGVSLRVISFYPSKGFHSMPVVMIPGLVSVMLSFKYSVLELGTHFVLHWVETREKSSSVVSVDASFDIESIGSDVIEVISRLGCEDGKYILIGASFSATAIIDRYLTLSKKPFCLVLQEPIAVFDYPAWSLKMIRLSLLLNRMKNLIIGSEDPNQAGGRMLKRLGKWYLKNFRMNLKEDYEMFRISSRAIDSANPHKLGSTILAISAYQVWDHLSVIQTPTLLVYASKDKLHQHEDLTKLSSMIMNCTFLDLENHQRTNGKDFADHFREYFKTLQKMKSSHHHCPDHTGL